jgi:crossover junction endodeoxyribonuclease RuvC
MIILGIDPGSRYTGYGVVETVGDESRIIEYGALSLSGDHVIRLRDIYTRLQEVMNRTPPDVCAIEMPVYGKNPQSMLKLGRAQAAAMLAALSREVPITEYTPKQVKKSVTGNGNASKMQVWYMVRSLLDLKEDRGLDAADALAVCMCHSHRIRQSGLGGGSASWRKFIEENPDRVRK